MTELSPATPSLKLVEQWVSEVWHEGTPVRVALSDMHIAIRAAEWGYQQCEAKYGSTVVDGCSLKEKSRKWKQICELPPICKQVNN